MKILLFRLISLIVALIPLMANAQTNIQSAFDAIINCPEALITESHTLDKDPLTKVKTGQSDVYHFVLPAEKINLIKNIVLAFDNDSEVAYSINRGKTTSTDSEIQLAIGDTTIKGVRINDPDREYIYALFLPSKSEDPNGIYRYAYGMNFEEEGDELIGKLVITYATTLKYRQQVEQERQLNVLHSFSNGTIPQTDMSQQTWFDLLMSCFQTMAISNYQTRIALATKAYKVIRNSSKYPEVTPVDIDSAREILKGMISEYEFSDVVLNKLLSQCLKALK